MIQVKELRFGNKVYNRTGEVITVQQIHFNTIVYDSQMKVDASDDYGADVLTRIKDGKSDNRKWDASTGNQNRPGF